MNIPTLYVFAISHYCEKARWALDYLEIDHRVEFLSPGTHFQVAKELGAKASSLPILVSAQDVIQGSANIIDWAQENTVTKRTLTPHEDETDFKHFEERLDRLAGVNTRCYFYSEALIEHPAMVLQIFTADLSAPKALALTQGWSVIRELMIQNMDLGIAQGKQAMEIVDQELAWIDGLLADGRSYLVANQFSRADVTAASLFSRLAAPQEHPGSPFAELPPRMLATQKAWHNRPSLKWVKDIYRKHRNAA